MPRQSAEVPSTARLVALEERIQTVCLLILTALGIAYALKEFRGVLIPFVLAILLTYCLTPAIDAQVRWLRLPRVVAVVSTILIGGVVLFLFGLFVTAAVGEVRAHVTDYQAQFDRLMQELTARLPLERLGVEPGEVSASLVGLSGRTAVELLGGTVSGIMSVVSNGTLVLIFLIFMLAGRAAIPLPPGSIRFEIESRSKRYLFTLLFVSALTGVLVGGSLALIGVPFAWMFGFLAFLLNFIPSIGSIIATLLPLPVVLLSPELGPVAKILALAVPSVIQFTIGNIVQPKILGTSLDLHPVTIIMALISFGLIWGIVGMLLATPLTAIMKFVMERFEYTRPVAEILAGRLEALSRAPRPAGPAGQG
jgi:AI-2 transport protein TqsA